MSLKPQTVCPVPSETVRVARAAFPRGNAYLDMRDLFGTFFQDEQFSGLFSSRGQPAEAPWRLALVTVMQFAEKLSDRQAADAVRARIDWKYALSLELTDEGFDYSVLSQFRTRLLAGGAEENLLEAMLSVFQEKELLKTRGKQRTDSTHVVAAVRILNRLSCVGEAMRAVLNTLAEIAPAWLRSHLLPHLLPEWPARYGPRFEEHRLPETSGEQHELALCIGRDGYSLLAALDTPTTPTATPTATPTPTPEWLANLPVVQTFRRIWIQHFTRQDETVIWREEADTPPAALRIHSIYEPDARYSTKRTTTWTGYKVHLTETCEEDAPNLITHVETTPATTMDAAVVEDIHTDLAQKERLPSVHLVDAGYVDAERLVQSEAHGVDLYGPIREDSGWQARAKAGFGQSDFVIDWSAHEARCPQGKTSTVWKASQDRHGKAVLHVEFDKEECNACPSRALCTRSRTSGRELTLRFEDQQKAIQAARLRQQTDEFKEVYALRAGIEGTLSQGLRGFALRDCRYRGLAKTHLQHLATAAAMNLARALAWVRGVPREKNRVSPLMRLVQAT